MEGRLAEASNDDGVERQAAKTQTSDETAGMANPIDLLLCACVYDASCNGRVCDCWSSHNQSADDACLSDLQLGDSADERVLMVRGVNNAEAPLMSYIDTGTFRARGGADKPRITNARGDAIGPKTMLTPTNYKEEALTSDFDDTESHLETTAEGSFVGKQQLTSPKASGSRAMSEQATRLTFENWLAGKKKKNAQRAAARRNRERDSVRAAEQRRRLSAQKYDEWLMGKARQAREALLARCAIATKPAVRQRRPHEYLTDEEMRQRVEEWERRKIIESEQKRERKKQFVQAQRDYVEQRQRQAQRAWENWVAARSPSSRARSRLSSTLPSKAVSSIYVNPRGWQSAANANDEAPRTHKRYGHSAGPMASHEHEHEQEEYQNELSQHLAYLDQQYEQQQQQQQQYEQQQYEQQAQHQHEYEQYGRDSQHAVNADDYERGSRHSHGHGHRHGHTHSHGHRNRDRHDQAEREQEQVQERVDYQKQHDMRQSPYNYYDQQSPYEPQQQQHQHHRDRKLRREYAQYMQHEDEA